MNGYFIGASIFARHAGQTSRPLSPHSTTSEWPKFCQKPHFVSKQPIFARHWRCHDVASCGLFRPVVGYLLRKSALKPNPAAVFQYKPKI